MLTEFKRTNAMKDLERILNDIDKSQTQIANYDSQINMKEEELHNVESIGLSHDEVTNITYKLLIGISLDQVTSIFYNTTNKILSIHRI